FRTLPLPAATRVRSASGAPGPDYWQQRADYVIRATLDTAGSAIRGSERIHYANHSPDTLAFVWVQIEQNIFAKNSVTYALNQPPLHFAGGAVFDFTGKGFIGGITIERFRAAGRELARTEYGTMMRVELPRPLAPRGVIDFAVAWHFPVPPYGGRRSSARAWRRDGAPPSACRSSRKRKQPRTALSGPRAPRPGTSPRATCATSPGPPPPISAGTHRPGTAS